MYVRGYLQGSENGRVVTIDWRYHFIFNLFEVLFNNIILFYIYTWILVVKSTLLMSLDVGKSRILTIRGLTKTRTKGGGYRVVSPQKVSRFAPLNRYYIIIDEVFFDNFLVIIYLLVVYKK